MFTDLFRLEAPLGENIIVGFYTTPPFESCQRDLVTINAPAAIVSPLTRT